MASGYRFESEKESTDEQEVIACGRNDTGQLGVGDTLERPHLQRVLFSELNKCRVLLLATGTHHTLALTTHEKTPLFGWGWAKYGQLGNLNTASCVLPTALPVTNKLDGASIIDISAGYSHSAFVTSSGKLFTSGRNDMGQLGLGHTVDVFEFTHVRQLQRIVKIALGEYFCIALERNPKDNSEHLWAFGSNEFGQLGLGDLSNRSVAHQVQISDLRHGVRVHLLRTGPFHCVVSLTNHKILSWGRGDCGQTGLGHRQNTTEPTPMSKLMSLVGEQQLRLLSVRAHNIAVTGTSGEVIVWGRNNHAQLGLVVAQQNNPDGNAQLNPLGGSDLEDHAEPQVNSVLPTYGVIGSDVADVAVGPFHTSVIMNDGSILMWGAISEYGMPKTHLRTESLRETASHIPEPMAWLRGRIVCHLGAGYSHVIFVLDPQMKVKPSTLSSDLGVSLDDPTYSDISLMVQDKQIRAHRVILSARSRFFRAMFASGMIESTLKEVTIRDCTYEAFYGLILFLYTDNFYHGRMTSQTAQLALEVLPLAELYDVPRLIQLCETVLIECNVLNVDNASELYEIACRLRAFNLKRRCYWFVSKYYDQVAQTESWRLLSPELKSHFRSISELHIRHSSPPPTENSQDTLGTAIVDF